MDIDISSDIDAALRELPDFFQSQVPFALAGAVVDTAFDIRRRIVGSTWGEAFDVNNARFPGVLFRVKEPGGGRPVGSGAAAGMARQLRGDGTAGVDVGGVLPRGYTEDHAQGGTKKPKGATIAIPTEPSTVRTSTGRVSKPKKPLNITKRRDTWLLEKGGRKVAIMQKKHGAKDSTAIYIFAKSAEIPKRFRFYEDATDTALRVFSGHFDARFAAAVRSSRFFPG